MKPKRSVIITGSTRGIGFQTAIKFLAGGDRVVIFCRHRRHAESAVRRLRAYGAEEDILALAGDVRRQKDAERIVDLCLERFGGIDVLINNAGVFIYKTVEETGERQWDAVIGTNLKGTFLFTRQVVPVMKRQKSGIIINISSALGVEAEAKLSAYCASKFGVMGLTRAVADETAESGILVYAVLPWAVNTTLGAGSGLELDPSQLLTPEYVAGRIFEAARGRRKTGALFEVHS
ncbi:MAG: SDR family NAD(P)-dependent oxidoreductase [Nitrospiraceae bacterium]|nr:SDR family NAD(P)-dependent oxidoreductase [Nitrospiraceae bacterium]